MTYIKFYENQIINILDTEVQIVKKIAESGYGNIWKAYFPAVDKHYALKIFRNDGDYDDYADEEIKLLSKLHQVKKSQNKKVHCLSSDKSFTLKHEDDETYKGVILKLFDMDLQDYVFKHRKDKGFKKFVLYAIQEIISSVAFINSCGYIHGDLKLNNILVKKNKDKFPTLCLCDYSMAHNFNEKREGQFCENTGYVFNYLENRPPEIILDMPFNLTVDSWNIATITYRLLTGKDLFKVKEYIEMSDDDDYCSSGESNDSESEKSKSEDEESNNDTDDSDDESDSSDDNRLEFLKYQYLMNEITNLIKYDIDYILDSDYSDMLLNKKGNFHIHFKTNRNLEKEIRSAISLNDSEMKFINTIFKKCLVFDPKDRIDTIKLKELLGI